MNTNGCLSNGWSVITSAPTNSQLAGVLAGFVFTGIIILFGRHGPANTRTLGLFCSTFVVLAFGSYLFSLISGGSFDSLCLRIWSETMAASGMLAVGGAALISGIAWLLADYAHEETAGGTRTAVNLGKLSRFMVLGVAAGVTLLLGMTTLDYISVVAGRRSPTWLILAVYLLPVVVVAFAALLASSRISRMRTKSASRDDRLPTSSLSAAVFSTLGYGIVTPLFAGGVTNVGDDVFRGVSSPLVVLSVMIGFVVPVALVVLLVYAVPSIEALEVDEESLGPGVGAQGGADGGEGGGGHGQAGDA